MPENVSLAFVRLSSMVAWIADHPGVHVDEICSHFGRTRRQVRRDIERDKILTAPQAAEYGLIDQVLESRKVL